MSFTLTFRNEHRWNLIVFLAWHVIESLLHKEESSLIFSAKKLICIGEKSVPQIACLLSEVKKYTAELSFGSSRNTLSRRAQMSTEICSKLFTRRRIAIDLSEFRRIPKAGHITDYSKAESTGVEYDLQRCVTPQLSFLLFHFVAFHYDIKINLLRRSFS